MRYLLDPDYWIWLSGFIVVMGAGFSLSVLLAAKLMDYALTRLLHILKIYRQFVQYACRKDLQRTRHANAAGETKAARTRYNP